MIPATGDSAYWHLVQQLMLRGWYRLGQGPHDASNLPTWGFREGHLLETPAATIRWIASQNEQRAMQSLLATLAEDASAGPKRRRTAAPVTPPLNQQSVQHYPQGRTKSVLPVSGVSDDHVITTSR
jgi:hypothetical protein